MGWALNVTPASNHKPFINLHLILLHCSSFVKRVLGFKDHSVVTITQTLYSTVKLQCSIVHFKGYSNIYDSYIFGELCRDLM